MLLNLVRRALNTVGIDAHRISKNEWRWSYEVGDYMPVHPVPRWGYGKPPHPIIADKLNQQRDEITSIIHQLTQLTTMLASVPSQGSPDSEVPYWENGWFGHFDAAALVGMLARTAPTRYLEIGSGNSTKFARYAIQHARLSTSIISLDPQPRAAIDDLSDTIIRRRLEDCDLTLFDKLEFGDILFFDGSHRVFTNSDATVFFLEVMPRLRPGIIVHIHDIFLPWDYPPDFRKRLYSEQYVLAAMMLCPQQSFKVILPNFFACTDPDLTREVASIMHPLSACAQGSSFWIETL
jgi:Methyltransferase domain